MNTETTKHNNRTTEQIPKAQSFLLKQKKQYPMNGEKNKMKEQQIKQTTICTQNSITTYGDNQWV